MTNLGLKKFINAHLYNELRYMLCATASWNMAKENPNTTPRHFVVYTMDSALLHARSLFEFFTHTDPARKKNLVTWKDFNLEEAINSELYKEWIKPLHHHVMHLENRFDVTNEINGVHLKDMVTKFSAEIVNIWSIFSAKINKDLKNDMDYILEKSITEAEGIYPQLRKVLII